MARPALLTLIALLLAAPHFARAQREESVRRAPVPDWVLPRDLPSDTAVHMEDTEDLLVDRQVHVGSPNLTFVRRAFRVHTAETANSLRQISVDFDEGESLLWHHVRRTRNGESVDLLPQLEIRNIQPEERLDDGVYLGTRRSLVFVEDVRVGDVFDYAFTWVEPEQALQGRFARRLTLAGRDAARDFRVRVLWPEGRTVRVRSDVPPSHRGEREFIIERSDVPETNVASDAPGWFSAEPVLELSEFPSWADVAGWGVRAYQSAMTDAAPSVQAFVRELRQLPADQRVTRAVRFVQDDIRYLSLSNGVHGLAPHPASTTLERRYGDCKDKTALLVTLLRALGIKADPMLVSTTAGARVGERVPSPYAFDHVIARAEVEGQVVWIDATARHNGGPVTSDPVPEHGLGLVLAEGATGLSSIDRVEPDEPSMDILERLTLTGNGTAHLEVRTVFRHDEANDLRGRLASMTSEELQQEYLEFYEKEHGKLEARQPLVVRDDTNANQITVSEDYTLASFWDRKDRHQLRIWSLADKLPELDADRPEQPLTLPYPLFVRHRLEIYDEDGWEPVHEDEPVDHPAFRFRFSSQREADNVLKVEYRLQTLADHVAVEDLPAYVTAVDTAGSAPSYEIWKNDVQQLPAPVEWTGLALAALALCGAGWGALRMLTARRRPESEIGRPAGLGLAAGELPQHPVDLAHPSQMATFMASLQCCGDAMSPRADGAPEAVRYGDGTLLIGSARCGKCTTTQRRYFRLAD